MSPPPTPPAPLLPLLLEYASLWGGLRREPLAWAAALAAAHPRLVAFWATVVALLVAALAPDPASSPDESGAALKAAATTRRKLFHAAAALLFLPPCLPAVGWRAVVCLAVAQAAVTQVLASVEMGRFIAVFLARDREQGAGRAVVTPVVALAPAGMWALVARYVAQFEPDACTSVDYSAAPAAYAVPATAPPASTPASPPTAQIIAPRSALQAEARLVLGPVLLLVGCAVPVWLTLAARTLGRLVPQAEVEGRGPLPMLPLLLLLLLASGTLAVGVGDAAAAVAGTAAKARGAAHRWGALLDSAWASTLGRFSFSVEEEDEGGARVEEGPERGAAAASGAADARAPAPPRAPTPAVPAALPTSPPWSLTGRWREKTLEGTLAFALAFALGAASCVGVSLGLEGLGLGVAVKDAGYTSVALPLLAPLAGCAVAAALAETFVDAADNVIAPLVAWGCAALFAFEGLA